MKQSIVYRLGLMGYSWNIYGTEGGGIWRPVLSFIASRISNLAPYNLKSYALITSEDDMSLL